MTKKEIEDFLKGKGDFVQIDHLTRFIKTKDVPTDKKKFVYQKLSELYAKKKMYGESARMQNNISISSHIFSEKVDAHVKEAQFCIIAGDFKSADEAVKKAMGESNVSRGAEIYVQIKEFYKDEGERLLGENKKGQAMKLYEKMLELRLTESDREEVKEKLMKLYESLGKVKEFFKLKGNK